MTLALLLPALVAILGVLVYALATNAKVAEIGRLAYACGLLTTLLVVAHQMVRI